MGSAGRHLIGLGVAAVTVIVPASAAQTYGWFTNIANTSKIAFVQIQSTDPGGAGHDNELTVQGRHHDKDHPEDIPSQHTFAIYDTPYILGPGTSVQCHYVVVPWKWFNGALEVTGYVPAGESRFSTVKFLIYEDNNQITLKINDGQPQPLFSRDGEQHYNVTIKDDSTASSSSWLTVQVTKAN